MEVNELLLQKINELEKKVSIVTSENEKLKAIVDEHNGNNTNRDYKDRLFKFIFGNTENKEWTLSLYNAINGTDYTNPDDITFNTIDDVVYLRMKNDMSFIVTFVMNLWEHQSSYNPNMPMRFFIYGGELYDKYSTTNKYNKFSTKLQPIPVPKCICFYNGTKEQPENQVLRLSDAYKGDGDIEVCVTMLNINYGKNKNLMDACKPLQEYAWTVESVRRLQNENLDLDSAVDKTINDMPDDFLIKRFLLGNRAEVKMSFLRNFDEEKELEQLRIESYEDGRIEGREEGREQRDLEIATEMIKDKCSLDRIIKYSKLSKEKVISIADALGISVT